MADAAVVETEAGMSDTPMVMVSFQKNTQRKLKFLEGEPKALGITQICLSIFMSACMPSFVISDEYKNDMAVFYIVSSILIFIAGCVAIAARNLHIPTLKACVGMEIVAVAASFFNLIILFSMDTFYCFHHDHENNTFHDPRGCRDFENSRLHLLTELVVVQLTLLSISVTLAVYACKVVNCCAPTPKVPVIEIQTPPAAQ